MFSSRSSGDVTHSHGNEWTTLRRRVGARLAPGARAAEREAGDERVHDPSWQPAVTVPGPPPPPGRGLVLNLLEATLPHVTAGYAQRSRTVCAAQRRRGLEPVVATRLGFPASRGMAFEPVETVDGVPCHRFWIRGLRHYTAVPRDRQVELNVELAAGLAAAVRPTLLWAATPHLNGLVGLALRDWLGVPLVYDVRGFPDLTWRTEHQAAAGAEPAERTRAAEARCMRAADAVVTLSETMRTEAVARGADPRRTWVLPHAVDLEPAGDGEAAAVRSRWALGADDLVVGHVGTLRRYEGTAVLVRAIARARARGGVIKGLIVGAGPARGELERLVAELGVGEHVLLTGPVDSAELAAHYAACDAIAVPRLEAPVCERVTPLKLIEAMAAGRCVVASRLPALEEAAEGSAVLVDPSDADALATTLETLASEPERRARLGARARSVAERHHSLAVLDERLAHLAETLGVAVETPADAVGAA